MERKNRLIDYYLPPSAGFVLESLVATTYQVDFEFLEEELLAAAFGVRSPVSRLRAFRSELERKMQKAEVTLLYDQRGCEPGGCRLSPRIDPIPILSRKLHSKISLLTWVRENAAVGAAPDRRMRLIIGSANLTWQGFRQNYECVAAVDFGARSTSPRSLLLTAVGLVQQIAAESKSPQLARQLLAFRNQANQLQSGTASPDDPVAIVNAEEVVPTIRTTWSEISNKPPDSMTIISPFWPEGVTAAEALSGLVEQVASPPHLEFVCRGERSPNGKAWLPVFDASVAVELRKRLSGRLFLRATLPETATPNMGQPSQDNGDETEERELALGMATAESKSSEMQRSLHAKVILLDGREGSVLYTGSSNCTRRGLGLGGPTNFEAGLIYKLTSRQRRVLSSLTEFAGPATEVRIDHLPATIQPALDEECVVPTFLGEITALGSLITVSFRNHVPADLVLLMPIPGKAGGTKYWLIYRADAHHEDLGEPTTVDLASAPVCDGQLAPLAPEPLEQKVNPNVFVEVRWEGHSATYPVRFDDKTRLPLILAGRKPTEGELIEYFLFGTEPDPWDEASGLSDQEARTTATETPIDTRKILAYFVRKFVQAIPGIETEIQRATYSPVALDAALRGPISPLELAERAFASLKQHPKPDEPPKTPIAVGFQLTEILAALLRCRLAVIDPELRMNFDPVIARVRALLDMLVSEEPELQADGFRRYRLQILGDAQ